MGLDPFSDYLNKTEGSKGWYELLRNREILGKDGSMKLQTEYSWYYSNLIQARGKDFHEIQEI